MHALALLAAVAVSQPAPDAAARCASVRVARQLALAERLDDSTLAVLEQRHCTAARPPEAQPPAPRHHEPHVPPLLRPSARAGKDCEALTTMARLARLDGAAQDLVSAVEAQRAASCALGDAPAATWPNGRTAKYGDDQWQYPNGRAARYGDGQWQYPSGRTARYGKSQWQYPNGRTARYGDGQWLTPAGRAATERDLVAAACAGDLRRCQWLAASLDSASGDERHLAVIELAWSQAAR